MTPKTNKNIAIAIQALDNKLMPYLMLPLNIYVTLQYNTEL